ncbi:UNVERIFIED_CONTAM: hypothetical protein FKN15_051100 [Acipenser sinensis]
MQLLCNTEQRHGLSLHKKRQHAESEGALQADSGSLQAGASVGTLASSLGESEAERPSMEEDEEEADYEELGLSKESLERLNPSDSEMPSQGVELPAFRAEEGEDEEDEILMGDDQVADFASSMLAAISCWHYRARALLSARFTTNGEGCDLIEENGFQRQNSQSAGNEEQHRSVEGGYLIEQTAGEVEQVLNEETHSESEDRCSEEHPSYSEPVSIAGQPPDAPEATEHPEPEDDQTEERQETALESVSADTAEEPKTLSSGESSEEEEEEEPTTECEPQGILPPSVLDQASVIAERFMNNLSRRDSLIMEDGRSLSCPSPRLTSRSSSVLSLDAIEKAQKHSSTSSEPPGIFTSREATALQANSTQESTSVLSPNSDNLFELERTPYRRMDSTLSKQDRLLIDKIKSYYDHAEHQDSSFSIKRRESLTYIPPGLVRNSVCRFNNIPKDEPAPEVAVRKGIGGSVCTINSRPASWTVFDLPAMGKNSGPEPIAPKLEESSSLQHSETGSLSAENHFQNPVTDEEFKPSTEMIKVWQRMEKEVNSTHIEHSRTEIPEEVHPSGRPSPHLSRKGQVSNGSIAPKYNDSLMILEDDDLSTITEESSNSSPDKGSPRTMLFGRKPSWHGSEGYEGNGVRTLRAPTPRIIHLGSCFDDEMQDMEQVKNRVFQLARHFSQRTKTNKPVVKQRGMDGAGQLKKRNLPSVQEEKTEKENKGKPNLTLSLPVYDKVILQELSPSPQHKSPAQQCPSPVHTPGSSVSSPRILSPSRPRSKSPLSPVQSESFHWPDVQELRSKYVKKETESGQSKLLSVARSCSVPEKMLEFPEGRSSNFNSTANIQFGIRGRTASTSAAEHQTAKALQLDKAEGFSHPHAQICRTGSLDQRISGHHLDDFKNLRNEDKLKNMFYVSGDTTLPSEQKVIVMEKVPQKNIDVDIVETGEDLEDDDDSFVQIRSPTTREKISIRAVIERCKAYQESEEYRQREDSGKPDQGTMKGKAKEQDRPAFSNDQNRKPNLTLSLPVYDKVILQELSPSPQHKSPAQQCPSPVHTPGSSVSSPRILSPSRPCSKSPLSPVQSESFHWPDVQELRSKYVKKETESGQSKLLSVARSYSVPEKMLEFPEGRSSNFNSTANIQFGVRGRTASTSAAEHQTTKALQLDKAEGFSHPHAQICRTGSLDQRISGHHLDDFKNLRNEDKLKNMFYVSGDTTLPSEQKVIVMEKVPQKNIDVDIVETGEDLEDDDDSFVQIRSPTTREKISIRAVIERCKAYQESEEYRQREDSGKPDQGTMKGKAKEQDRPAFSNDQNVAYRRGSVPAAKKTDINQQSLVKNLREKFQNLSSNT